MFVIRIRFTQRDPDLFVGRQSDRAAEGTDGFTEGHGGHVTVSARR